METPVKKKCPNCSRLYQIKSLSPQIRGNIPLFLKCGHTMCETCITNIIKFGVPSIQCKFCKQAMELEASFLLLVGQNKTDLYEKFPINTTMLGELILEINNAANPIKQEDCYIDLNELETSKGHCVECQVATNKMCMKCASILCDKCFNKSHENFFVFKSHILQPIGTSQINNTCKIHKAKQLEYYCKDCNIAICIDCTFVGEKSCREHNVVAINYMNEACVSELSETAPTVDEVFKRLTKTAVDVGSLIQSFQCDSDTAAEHTKIICDIEQHFSKINLAVQQHKKELIGIVNQVKTSELQCLRHIQSDIKSSMIKAKDILNSIDIIMNTDCPQGNIAALLEEAKLFANTPWYLDKVDNIKELAKLEVNDNLCTLVNEYVRLEGNLKTEYKLYSTKDIKEGTEIPSPPKGIVYPPKVTKDIGQIPKGKGLDIHPPKILYKDVPKFRPKTASNSSLNSLNSNNSENKAYVTPFNNFPKTTQEQQQENEPRPFQEGTQELIYVSHIVDPYNFYVQRAGHQDLINLMIRDFRNALSVPKPALNHVTEGKHYLALNKVDDMWQRCRILSVDKNDTAPRFKVFFVDFGSTAFVKLENLRLLPLAKQNQPPLAVKCSLANCAPKHGSWISDDALLIHNIIKNEQAVMHVRNIRIDNNSEVTIECDLTTLEEGISLAHALVFHERANLIEPNLPYPKPKYLMEKPKLIKNNSNFRQKAVEEVYITCVVNPDIFFVIKQHLQSVYEKLTEDLEHEYSMVSDTGTIFLPEIGMFCAVNLEKSHDHGASAAGEANAADGGGARWARAVVRELPGRGRVLVMLPDSGATLLVHWKRLKYLHHKFTTIAALASECHLAGVSPLSKKWSTGSVELLNKYKDKLLELHVEDTSRQGSIGVTLIDNLDEENIICINKEMIKYKFAIQFGLSENDNTYAIEEQLYTYELNEMAEPEPKEKQIKIHTKAFKYVAAKPHTEEHNLDAIDKGPIRLEAQVLYYDSPSLIYISLEYQKETFNTLYDNIQAYYSKNETLIKEDWKEGDRCCALCGVSQTWRRAYILEKEEKLAKIFYSDFAVTEKVPLTNLRELAPEFKKGCDAAIKCHLYDVMSITGAEWPGLAKEYFQELMEAYPCLYISKHGKFKNNSMPVEIWAYHVTSKIAEWRCLNKKIIEQGLGVPERCFKISANKDKDKAPDDIDGKDWNDVTEEEGKKLQYPEYTEKTFLCNIMVVNCVELLELNIIHDDETNLVYDELYEKIRKEYHTMPILNEVLKNKPCIAIFHEDNQWYRASILQYDEAKQSAIVRFVDYGNIEVVPLENVREIDLEWVKLPPATVSVKLHGIEVNPGIAMDVILEYYASTFLDNGQYHSKIIDYENSIPIVELTNDQGELIYENLIEEGIYFRY